MSRLQRWIQHDAGLQDGAPLRFVLGKAMYTSRRNVVMHVLVAIGYIALLLVLAEALQMTTGTLSAKVYQSLYLPTILAQGFVSAAAFAFTLHMVGTQRRNQIWDQLRTAAGGTREAMRATWAATVYYRLSGLFGVLIYAPRLVLLGLLLYDLTAFRGEYLTMIAGGHTPELLPLFELPLFAAFIAAAFLLPLSAVGLEAAVGLLFSTFVKSRQTTGLLQVLLTAARFAWAGVSVILLRDLLAALAENQPLEPLNTFVTLLVGSAAGDWGLTSLHAATIDTLWANIPYAAFAGVLLLGVVLLHSGLTVLILRWAAERAQSNE